MNRFEFLSFIAFTWILSGVTFHVFQEERHVEYCKEAGWKFIDDNFDFNKDSPGDMALLRHMQSTLATNCILKFKGEDL